MSKPTPLYTIQRHVTDSDADFARRQRLSSMFSMFQDIAALHADNLGASVKRLHEELNVAWILMRVRIEVDSYPALAQDIIVETWPQAPRALYERDYRIRDMDGNILVRSASIWVIMDLAAREIKRDKFLDYFGLEMVKDRALGKGFGRLKSMDGAELVYEKEMRVSELDYNLHVNNAKYVDLIMDSFPFETHQNREIKAIEVHYINETSAGDVLQIYHREIDESTVYIECKRKSDGMSVIGALIEWGRE
jgi:acyl-ACP thioesterase